MRKLYAWTFMLVCAGLVCLPECQTPMYIVPASIIITYVFLWTYPWIARSLHQRKLTYEDLEDLSMEDARLQRRFQIVFTRVQQVGGALCAGIVTAYSYRVFKQHESASFMEFLGVLGGLLSLYARILGYVGKFCIKCLYKMKKRQTWVATTPEQSRPNTPEPQETHNEPASIQHSSKQTDL